MESCLETLSTVRGEGLCEREPQSGSSMLGAIGKSSTPGVEIVLERCRQLVASMEGNNALRYLRA